MQRHSILFVAAALACACASKHENVVHVIAEQAPGLKKSARVQYRGIDVGLVKQVYFTPSGVRIDLLLERQDVPIRTQDTVRIHSVGAFGEQVVDIRAGNPAAPLIVNRGSLPAVQPDTTVAVPVEAWRSIVRTLNTVVERDSAGVIHVRNDTTGLPRGVDESDTVAVPVPRPRRAPRAKGAAPG
jgi:ABC-type transporter Mla subunit MlaD